MMHLLFELLLAFLTNPFQGTQTNSSYAHIKLNQVSCVCFWTCDNTSNCPEEKPMHAFIETSMHLLDLHSDETLSMLLRGI